jgi:hypothetical protein
VIKFSELTGSCKCDYDSSYSTKDAVFDLEQEELVYVGVPSRRISSCVLGSPNTRLLQLQNKGLLQISPTTGINLAVVIPFHTANGLPITFPNLGDIVNKEDLEDV